MDVPDILRPCCGGMKSGTRSPYSARLALVPRPLSSTGLLLSVCHGRIIMLRTLLLPAATLANDGPINYSSAGELRAKRLRHDWQRRRRAGLARRVRGGRPRGRLSGLDWTFAIGAFREAYSALFTKDDMGMLKVLAAVAVVSLALIAGAFALVQQEVIPADSLRLLPAAIAAVVGGGIAFLIARRERHRRERKMRVSESSKP